MLHVYSTGFGLGMAYLPAIVAVSFYFEKYRSLATGIAVCGSGLGTFIFAPLTSLLLVEYSWKGTVLIETGILLNCILCGMVFRPLNLTPSEAVNNAPNCASDANCSGAVNPASADETKKITSSWTALPQTANVSADEARRRTHSESWTHQNVSAAKAPTAPTELKLTTRKDVFYTKSLDNIPMYKTDPDQYYKSMTTIHDEETSSNISASCLEKIGLSKETVKTMEQLMDFKLFLDVSFVIFAISNLLTSIGFVVPYIFLYDRGIQKELDARDAAWLISVVGISNTFGRILFGYIADFPFVNRLMLYNTVLVICGLVSIFSFVCINFWSLIIYSFLFGLLIGMYFALRLFKLFQQAIPAILKDGSL